MVTTARKIQQYVENVISITVNYNTTGLATGVEMPARIPAGSIIDKTTVLADTAFNGTTSVALSVGFTLTGTDLINGTDVRTAAVRVDTVAPVAKARCVADTQLFVSAAFGGTIGTAGVATVIVRYLTAVG